MNEKKSSQRRFFTLAGILLTAGWILVTSASHCYDLQTMSARMANQQMSWDALLLHVHMLRAPNDLTKLGKPAPSPTTDRPHANNPACRRQFDEAVTTFTYNTFVHEIVQSPAFQAWRKACIEDVTPEEYEAALDRFHDDQRTMHDNHLDWRPNFVPRHDIFSARVAAESVVLLTTLLILFFVFRQKTHRALWLCVVYVLPLGLNLYAGFAAGDMPNPAYPFDFLMASVTLAMLLAWRLRATHMENK